MKLYFRRVQVHSIAAGGAGEQRVPDRREHAVPRHEGESGARAAGHEALPVALPGRAVHQGLTEPSTHFVTYV